MVMKVNMSKPTRGATAISFLCLPTAVPGVRVSFLSRYVSLFVSITCLLTTYRVDSLLWLRGLSEYFHLADTQRVLE